MRKTHVLKTLKVTLFNPWIWFPCKVNREDREAYVDSDDKPCGVIGLRKVFVPDAYLREEVELLRDLWMCVIIEKSC